MTAVAVRLIENLRALGVRLELRNGKIRALGRTKLLTQEHVACVREHAGEIANALRRPRVPLDEWLALRRTSVRAADASVTQLPSTVAPRLEHPKQMPPEQLANAAAACTVYVASVTRPPRYRCPPCIGADRVCCACGNRKGPNGPLGYSWDVHIVRNELELTCSPECRRVRGFAERKADMQRTAGEEN